MKIKKILNKNTVITIHESGEEVIVMESGLGMCGYGGEDKTLHGAGAKR